MRESGSLPNFIYAAAQSGLTHVTFSHDDSHSLIVKLGPSCSPNHLQAGAAVVSAACTQPSESRSQEHLKHLDIDSLGVLSQVHAQTVVLSHHDSDNGKGEDILSVAFAVSSLISSAPSPCAFDDDKMSW